MSFWPLRIHLVLFMMLSLAFTGCAYVKVWETPVNITGIETGDCIAVVLDFQRNNTPQEAEKLEKSIGDCISDAMVERNLSVRFIQPGEFRRAVFPGMNITSAIWDRQLILGLLSAPQFRDKIKSLNLRYLITVRERTYSTKNWEGGGVGDGWIHSKGTELVADIIDLQKASDSGGVQVRVDDTGFYGWIYIAFVPFPVIIPAFTEVRACQTFGRTVTKFLLGEKTEELSK